MPKNSKHIEEFLKMKGTSLMLTVSLLGILSIALVSAVPNQAHAQLQNVDYRCYQVATGVFPDMPQEQIRLVDQFFPNGKTFNLGQVLELCNPAVKAPEQVPGTDPQTLELPHLRCWELDDPNVTPNAPLRISVDVSDQFNLGDITHEILEPVEFCHTTFKVGGSFENSGDPVGPYLPGDSMDIANWLCYNIENKNEPFQPLRRLFDQFTETGNENYPDGIEVGEARLLCTPATKTYKGFTFEPTSDNPGVNQHLKCYDIDRQGGILFDENQEPNPPEVDPNNPLGPIPMLPAETIRVGDQFGGIDLTVVMPDDELDKPDDIVGSVTLVKLDKICIEAEKTLNIAGTFIPINSVAILLAGSQMTAAWILPMLVASAGVGYGIEIARKYHKDTK